MKTFETEKHNIPEGATHYSNETESSIFTWIKVGSAIEFWCDILESWSRASCYVDAIEIPVEFEIDWCSCGVPEAGSKCHVRFSTDSHPRDWFDCEIEYKSNDGASGVLNMNGESMGFSTNCNLSNFCEFRFVRCKTQQTKEVEWVNGDFAIYEGSIVMVIAYHPKHPVIVVETSTEEYINVGICDLSKPETEAERVERERLENGQSLYELVQSLWCTVDSKYTPHPYSSPMVDDKTKEVYARLARAVDYRKES